MKKKILNILNQYQNFNFIFNLFFIFSFFLLTGLSFIGYINENYSFIYICIFSLIFIINFWIICIVYSKKKSRNAVLELISMRAMVKKFNNLNGAEIGVYRGSYSQQIIDYFKSKKILLNLHLIEPWEVDSEFTNYGSSDLEDAYMSVKSKFENKKNIKIIKSTSINASTKYNDFFFDFVYIDGNHEYRHVKQDLDLWYPKLKNEGILFGDDYLRPYGVQKAVKEFAYEKKLIVHFTDNGNQFYFIKS